MHLEASVFLALFVLAGILERPFVTASGVGRMAFGTSLLSNLIASPIWFVIVDLAQLAIDARADQLHDNYVSIFVLAFAIQFAVKFLVVRVLARKPINAWCIFFGCGFSLMFIGFIFVSLVAINDLRPRLWIRMAQYVPLVSRLAYIVFLGALSMVAIESLACCLRGGKAAGNADERPRDQRGR